MLHFICNPTSGSGRARRVRKTITEILTQKGVAHTIHDTAVKGDAKRIAAEITQSGESEIIAVGGDGTLHEVLNGLTNPSEVHLGLIPCGSGNDFAAIAGIPRDVQKALDLILSGQTRPTDYLTCGDVRCINVLGTGIDVEILERAASAKVLHGSLNYFVSLVLALLGFEFYGMRVRYTGHDAHHNALIVCACNGRQIGGGIPICPAADLSDGMLNYVLVEDLTKKQIPLALTKLMRGRILEQNYTRHEKLEALSVTLDKPSIIQIDGEFYENLPFDVHIVKGGLNFYRG